jgi:hypothetical protein
MTRHVPCRRNARVELPQGLKTSHVHGAAYQASRRAVGPLNAKGGGKSQPVEPEPELEVCGSAFIPTASGDGPSRVSKLLFEPPSQPPHRLPRTPVLAPLT